MRAFALPVVVIASLPRSPGSPRSPRLPSGLSRRAAYCALLAIAIAAAPLAGAAFAHGADPGLRLADQPPAAGAADAAEPAAPAAPLVHPRFGPPEARPGATSATPTWQQANETVARFPRGHADLVAWEARQRAAEAAGAAGAAAPPGGPAGHAGHRHHPEHTPSPGTQP